MSSGSKEPSGISTPSTDFTDLGSILTTVRDIPPHLDRVQPSGMADPADTPDTTTANTTNINTTNTTNTNTGNHSRSDSPYIRTPRYMLETGPNSLPIVGQKGAPKKFRGKSSEVELFIKHYERLCSQRSVIDDIDKVENITQYCSKSVRECIESLNSYTEKDWRQLKRDILELYDADRERKKFRLKHLERFVKESRQEAGIESKSAWIEYKREFQTIAGWLRKEGKLKDVTQEYLYFWYGIPKSFRNKLENRLLILQPNHDLETPFTIDQVHHAAGQLLCRNRFDKERYDSDEDEEFSDKDSDESSSEDSSDSDKKRVDAITDRLFKQISHKRRAHKKVEKERKASKRPAWTDEEEEELPKSSGKSTPKAAKEPELDLGELVNKLSRMSISDSNYAALFMKACKIDPAVKDVLESIQRQKAAAEMVSTKPGITDPMRNSRDIPPHMAASRPPMRCFGCGETGHSASRCAKVGDLVAQGIINREPGTGRVLFPNGDSIQRLSRDETIVQAVQRIRGLHSNYVTIEEEEDDEDFYAMYDDFADD